MKTKKIINGAKALLDGVTNPAYALLLGNCAYIYGANELLNHVSGSWNKHEAMAMAATKFALLIGGIGVNEIAIRKYKEHNRKKREEKIRKAADKGWERMMYRQGTEKIIAKKATQKQNISLLSRRLIMHAGQIGLAALLFTATNFEKTADMMWGDLSKNISASSRIEPQPLEVLLDDNVDFERGYYTLEPFFPESTNLTTVGKKDKRTLLGMYMRERLFDSIITSAERRHRLPEGILAALFMKESYSNPCALNSTGDGGAGGFMIQPGTAKMLGLKIYGNSKATGIDKQHGKELVALVMDKNMNYEALAAVDERFDIFKSSDAAARFLNMMYEKHGTWEKALSAYNQGKPAESSEMTSYVRGVLERQRYYISQKHGEDAVFAKGPRSTATERTNSNARTESTAKADNNRTAGLSPAMFAYRGKNSKGHEVMRYEVQPGDDIIGIEKKFNLWDDSRGGHFGEPIRIADSSGMVAAELLPGQVVYVLADSAKR